MFKIIKKLFLIYVKFLSVNIPYEELGTPYGGWQFIPLDKNEQLNVISAGVGEDISFDIELINTRVNFRRLPKVFRVFFFGLIL